MSELEPFHGALTAFQGASLAQNQRFPLEIAKIMCLADIEANLKYQSANVQCKVSYFHFLIEILEFVLLPGFHDTRKPNILRKSR